MRLTPPVVGLEAVWSQKIKGSVHVDLFLSVATSSKSAGSDAYVRPTS